MLPDNQFYLTFKIPYDKDKPTVNRDDVLNKLFAVLSKGMKIKVLYWGQRGIDVEIEDVSSNGLERVFIPFTTEQNCYPQPIWEEDKAPKYWECQP